MTVQFSAIASTMTDVYAKFVTQVPDPVIRLETEPLWSELARDDGSTSSIDASRPTAIASKLAPTGDLWR
ncbi:hypothetical protein CEQ51_16900 [Pseudomonas thivervalensis]|uniref:Uncharacterized protein n=1 Tax=Pseudomonas thivervalensis TaxID=86265 RepID=A0A176NNP0_9PSED|nr:hypothetical protein CE140_16345 [Pseudomonas thivervalensis]AXA61683.1 hypothetical protein CEQ51_16900 [Pseudomonas thivervalensis]OAB52791.1 hypothetical protein APS14_02545 [Pseudomonas thivervalensis]